jgi:hypothetical protein
MLEVGGMRRTLLDVDGFFFIRVLLVFGAVFRDEPSAHGRAAGFSRSEHINAFTLDSGASVNGAHP